MEVSKKYQKEILGALERAAAKPVGRLIFKIVVKPMVVVIAGKSNNGSHLTDNVIIPVGHANGNGTLINGLNPRYTFTSFVVGKGNELAYAASRATAQKPGLSYNPLFIYGVAGLGKTHLLQAIGQEIMAQNKNCVVRYATCEKFTNDFIQSVRGGRAKEFKDNYRNVDALLIDDIQFITGKEGTQEEFFHTFNELHQQNKQIVICSDRPPRAIATLEQRLQSRFEQGMIADISAPDLETRAAILTAKCQEKNFCLEENVLQYVAAHIQNNVRELEGALNRIIAHQQFNNQKITLENIKEILLLTNKASGRRGSLTPRQVIITVSNFYDINQDALLGASRKRELVVPRQIIMYLLREETSSSFPAIGQALGGRDHTTAIHAYKKISSCVEADEKIRRDLTLIKQQLYA